MELNISYYDTFFEKVYKSDYDSEIISTNRNVNLSDIINKCYSYAVKIDNKNYGYIILDEDLQHQQSFEYVKIAIEHATTVIKLNIQKHISNIQIEER